MARYYGIGNGRKTGIFGSYDHVKPYTDGYSNARHRGFDTYSEAHMFVYGVPWLGTVPFVEIHAEDGRVTRHPLTDRLAEVLRAHGLLP